MIHSLNEVCGWDGYARLKLAVPIALPLVRYTAVISFAVFALAACQPRRAAFCSPQRNCYNTAHAYLLGGTKAQKIEAKKELRLAADAYHEWLGQDPPHGLIRLDARVPLPRDGQADHVWSLTYDRSQARIFEATSGLDLEPATPRGESSAPASARSGNHLLALDQSGIISHEICHHYARFVFYRAWRGNRRLPEALGESAAVYCESRKLLEQRMARFVELYRSGKAIPWRQFFEMNHPVSESSLGDQLAKMHNRLGRGTVRFTIGEATDLGQKVAVYYSQAAALALFLRHESCRGNIALGDLLSSFDPEEGLDEWLAVRGERSCLPTSLREFDDAFDSFIGSQRLTVK